MVVYHVMLHYNVKITVKMVTNLTDPYVPLVKNLVVNLVKLMLESVKLVSMVTDYGELD